MTDSPMPAPERAAEVALGELDAFLALLRELTPEEWHSPTDCTGWAVRDVVAHVAGALEEGARVRAQLRRVLLAPRRHPTMSRLDAINQMQLDDRRGAGCEQLLREVSVLGPKAARARRRMPRVVRRRAVPDGFSLPPGSTFGYLLDVIYPRDLWMHRVDVARATGRRLRRTDTEADVVAQVVSDLAGGWDGPRTTLTLTGHGAGTWVLAGVGQAHDGGAPSATLEADAVELCRLLSGRPGSPAVTASGDPRAQHTLLASRIPF
jgi:uncharacterized protein (TIGR03083 family)